MNYPSNFSRGCYHVILTSSLQSLFKEYAALYVKLYLYVGTKSPLRRLLKEAKHEL